MSEPLFHAMIVVTEIVGISFSPPGVILGFERFAARGVVAGLLARPQAGVGHKQSGTETALPFSFSVHRGPLLLS